MNNGYWQKLLRVDLSSGRIKVERLEEPVLKRFLGGAGLGAEILGRELESIKAQDSENRLIFATGPFQGTAVPGSAKFSIMGISPLTGTYADTAAGGSWGTSLKNAGYDVIMLQGKSKTPIYLYIDDDTVELRDAQAHWGKSSYDAVDAIRKENRDSKLSVACIGPAGEKAVSVACIVIDKHSFGGRCGLGAVMGQKKIKAVAVKGSKTVPVADPEKVKALSKKFFKRIYQTTLENEFREHGTPGLCETAESLGDMPIKYWDGDRFPQGAKQLGAPNYTKVLKAKPVPCKFCPIGCHRGVEVTEPAEYATKGVGPEYETLGLMGTCCMISDPKAVAKANDVANRCGVDTISVGAMVAFAMQCYEKGWISKDIMPDYSLDWGNGMTLVKMTQEIGTKTGFGALFADGTLKAAQRIHPDSVETVVHNKGLDYPAHDPRSCNSLAPTYTTGTRGACHFRGPSEDVEMGGFFIPEMGIKDGMVKFFQPENQSLISIRCQDLGVIANSIVICLFMIDGGDLTMAEVLEIFNAITGWDFTMEQLFESGERGFTAQRLLNIRDGYDGTTDVLPKKMYRAAKLGFRKGQQIPFTRLMKDYYEIRGWDDKGIPSQDTLARLAL